MSAGAWTAFPRLGACPLNPDVIVKVEFRGYGRSKHSYKASQLRWSRHKGQTEPMPFDIIAYQVVDDNGGNERRGQ